MALGKTAKYYRSNPKARRVRLAQQKAYDQGPKKKKIEAYHSNLAAWKRKNAGSKPSGIAEAVHGPNGQIRWRSGEKARKENRGNEVRKRNPPSNPNGRAGKTGKIRRVSVKG